jgi:hypothetical protein
VRQNENSAAEATGRLIFLRVELSYFLFSFFVEVASLTAIRPGRQGYGSNERQWDEK